jgi:ketosteroid isomerase-like protein
MNRIFFVFSLLWSTAALAQDFRQEINDQVWKPFIASFSNSDADGFLAVHSKDVIRSPRDDGKVFGWNEYYRQQTAASKRARETGRSHSLELRFTERIAENDRAVEVGIYKTTSTDAKGEKRSYFGRFHVVLRKEHGTWKILVDTDSSEGETIGEKDFLAAKEM